MKAKTKEVPKDELSFMHGKYEVEVYIHKGFVNFNILREGKVTFGACVTPDEFIAILASKSR